MKGTVIYIRKISYTYLLILNRDLFQLSNPFSAPTTFKVYIGLRHDEVTLARLVFEIFAMILVCVHP